MHIEAIVTDMDDTLFDGEGKIDAYTLETMHECKRLGVRVIPASGRAQASMEPYMRQLDTGLPYIACNGSQLVRADHSVIETLTMPTELAREVMKHQKYAPIFRGFKVCPVFVQFSIFALPATH